MKTGLEDGFLMSVQKVLRLKEIDADFAMKKNN